MESPCTLVCSIDMETGWCYGCGRSRDEIGAWSLYTDQQRRDIMQTLAPRLEQIERKPRRVTKRRAMRGQR